MRRGYLYIFIFQGGSKSDMRGIKKVLCGCALLDTVHVHESLDITSLQCNAIILLVYEYPFVVSVVLMKFVSEALCAKY